MNDLISRKEAIDAMEQAKERYFDRIVSNLLAAQPERKKGRRNYRIEKSEEDDK